MLCYAKIVVLYLVRLWSIRDSRGGITTVKPKNWGGPGKAGLKTVFRNLKRGHPCPYHLLPPPSLRIAERKAKSKVKVLKWLISHNISKNGHRKCVMQYRNMQNNWGMFSKVALLAICEIFHSSKRRHGPSGPIVNTPMDEKQRI